MVHEIRLQEPFFRFSAGPARRCLVSFLAQVENKKLCLVQGNIIAYAIQLHYSGYPDLRAPRDKQAETCALHCKALLSVVGDIEPLVWRDMPSWPLSTPECS